MMTLRNEDARVTDQESQGKRYGEVIMKPFVVFIFVASAAAFAGCQHRSNSFADAAAVPPAAASPNDAIRNAIQRHLAHNGNLSLNSFDTEVKQVKLEGDHAQAEVEFHVKSGPGTMQLTY